jgi:hypothetical protein
MLPTIAHEVSKLALALTADQSLINRKWTIDLILQSAMNEGGLSYSQPASHWLSCSYPRLVTLIPR